MKTIKEFIQDSYAQIGFFLGVVTTIILIVLINPAINEPIIEERIIHDTIYVKTVKGTYYNPTKLNITANGTKLTRQHNKKVIALSRNLFKIFNMGDSLHIISPTRLAGVYYICDKLNKRFKNRIDIFTYTNLNIDSVVIKI